MGVAPNKPAITAVDRTGSILNFWGAHGPVGGTYRILTSTNLSAPLNTWTAALTNSFDQAGGFSNAVSINMAESSRFYLLSQP